MKRQSHGALGKEVELATREMGGRTGSLSLIYRDPRAQPDVKNFQLHRFLGSGRWRQYNDAVLERCEP
jgi:hypothetical protein